VVVPEPKEQVASRVDSKPIAAVLAAGDSDALEKALRENQSRTPMTVPHMVVNATVPSGLSAKCLALETSLVVKDRELQCLKAQVGSNDLAKLQQTYDQASGRVADLEQKLKDQKKELECQRHNADATKQNLEKKLKDQDRELKKEVQQTQQEAEEAKRALQKSEETQRQIEAARRAEINKVEAEKR
jgi:hypothetical protein